MDSSSLSSMPWNRATLHSKIQASMAASFCYQKATHMVAEKKTG